MQAYVPMLLKRSQIYRNQLQMEKQKKKLMDVEDFFEILTFSFISFVVPIRCYTQDGFSGRTSNIGNE